jgi:putative Ca2+/H+ antiporter (TMEM165/GDT1 family)
MPLSILFWVLMILWVIFAVWTTWPDHKKSGAHLLLFLLLLVLGWAVFGEPIQNGR